MNIRIVGVNMSLAWKRPYIFMFHVVDVKMPTKHLYYKTYIICIITIWIHNEDSATGTGVHTYSRMEEEKEFDVL